MRCAGACDTFLVEHVWWYNSGCDIIKLPWTNSATFRNSYFKQNFSASNCHGQFYLSEVTTSNVTFANNVIQDIQGTGMWVVVTGGQADNYNIYNNVILKTQGSSRPGFSNGFFACINSGSKCTNMKFIGNTVINYEADSSGAAGILSENNNGSTDLRAGRRIELDRASNARCHRIFVRDQSELCMPVRVERDRVSCDCGAGGVANHHRNVDLSARTPR